MAKVRPVGEGQVRDEGGRGRRRGPEEGQFRLPQGARALGVARAQLLLSPPPEDRQRFHNVYEFTASFVFSHATKHRRGRQLVVPDAV